MASYNDLATISSQAGWSHFFGKVLTAVRIKAAVVIDQTSPTAEALDWAMKTLTDGQQSANDLVWYIISVNNTASVAVILAAADTSVQANIDNAIDEIYGAGS